MPLGGPFRKRMGARENVERRDLRPSENGTLFRNGRAPCFEARVEPFWHAYRSLESGKGLLERWTRRHRLRRVTDQINRHLGTSAPPAERWDRESGSCICNLRVARMGLISEFKRYLGANGIQESATSWSHLLALRDDRCILIPQRFSKPLVFTFG